MALRCPSTVALWLAPVRSYYEWADAEGLLTNNVASRLTQLKYFAPGSPGGGEYGAMRRVLAEQLRASARTSPRPPEWIDDADARRRLETLPLRSRDRFLIDLFYSTGIRAGEALSLFTADLHFGGGTPELGCRYADPHFHVLMDNPVENGSQVKGRERVLYVSRELVEKYIDYVLERSRILGKQHDKSPHVFVNLYSQGESLGCAMKYSTVKKLVDRCSKSIDFVLSGPHVLRHTFATRLVRGIECEAQPLDVVQSLLGHSNINSTKIYTHDEESAKKAAMEALAPRSLNLETGA